MKLLTLSANHCLGCPDRTFDFRTPNGAAASVVAVTGGPSSGKTQMLGAITAVKEHVGSYGRAPDPTELLRAGEAAGTLSASWQLSPDERRSSGFAQGVYDVHLALAADAVPPLEDPGVTRLFRNQQSAPGLGTVVTLPSPRRSDVHSFGPTASPQLADDRVSGDTAKYARLLGEVIRRADEDAARVLERIEEKGIVSTLDRPDSLAPLRAQLAQLTPWLRLLGVERRGNARTLGFRHRNGAHLSLAQLGAFEMEALIVAAAMWVWSLHGALVLLDDVDSASGVGADLVRWMASTMHDAQIVATCRSKQTLAFAEVCIDLEAT